LPGDAAGRSSLSVTKEIFMRSIALLSVALVVLGCVQAKQPPPSPTAPEVTVVTVHRQPVPVTTELPGRTSAYLVAQVAVR
jgi:membrane fusion protein (multidrug efflux system)